VAVIFFTVITYRRQPLLIHPESRRILRDVIQRVQQKYPFVIDAWVLLPDHTHCVWTLPSGDSDYSKRWSLIKAGFSKRVGELFKREDWMNKSKVKHRESTLWQRRFWEHSIRNQEDFNHPIDVFIGIP
jgi:putative transposase